MPHLVKKIKRCPLKVKSLQNTKYCNISKPPGRGYIHPPYHGGGMNLRGFGFFWEWRKVNSLTPITGKWSSQLFWGWKGGICDFVIISHHKWKRLWHASAHVRHLDFCSGVHWGKISTHAPRHKSRGRFPQSHKLRRKIRTKCCQHERRNGSFFVSGSVVVLLPLWEIEKYFGRNF